MKLRLLLVAPILGASALGGAQSNYRVADGFGNVKNFKAFSKAVPLNAKQKAKIAQNLFVVVPSDDPQLYDVFANNDYLNLPSLITVDNVLQTFHVFFDSTLRKTEEKHLIYDVRRMTSALVAQATKRLGKSSGVLHSAALKNVAYFGVADRLAGGHFALPSAAKAMVDAEVAKIEEAGGYKRSSIFPYTLDYSQFIVRGHYTKSATLKEYFRAMMWYGLVPIALEQRVRTTLRPLPEQVRQAAMMVEDLYASKADKAWDRIYKLSSLYAGDSNNLTPGACRKAVRPILGQPANIELLKNTAVLSRVVAAARKASHPKMTLKKDDAAMAGDLQLRFMGQRAIPDSVAFSKLTDPYKRPWPSSLDVAAVLGSRRAATILDASPRVYNPVGWMAYRPIRQEIASQWASLPASAWSKDLYTGWLDALRIVLRKAPASYPAFMRSPAYQDKSIGSALGSWSELRHDTILYAQQSVAEMGDGDDEPPPFVEGYVEPNVPLYDRVKALLTQMRSGLATQGFLRPDDKKQFTAFTDLISFLRSVASRELTGGKISKTEYLRIRHIEGDFDGLTRSIQLNGAGQYEVLSPDDEDMAQIADVHTAESQAMEVGVGHADHLIAVVPIEGRLYLARGGVFSFYEFKVPMSQRMTDHAWKQFLQNGKNKKRPSWVSRYFVDAPAKQAR